MIFLGLSFIALIVFLPNGLYPLMEKTVLRKKDKKALTKLEVHQNLSIRE
jgi:hypothetical protein